MALVSFFVVLVTFLVVDDNLAVAAAKGASSCDFGEVVVDFLAPILIFFVGTAILLSFEDEWANAAACAIIAAGERLPVALAP